MATHLVRILSRLGWVSVPEPARSLFSVADTMSLCGRHTMSLWQTHSVSVWKTHSPGGGRRAAGGGGRFASNSNPTRSHQSPLPTHKIAILRCRGIRSV